MATKQKRISPFRLTSLLRLEKDPALALHLFRNANPAPSPRPLRQYSYRSYDLLICKLGRARMFGEMEQVLDQMSRETTRFIPKEALFCHVISFYGRARCPELAARAFERIPSFGCGRTVRSFNSLLNALLNCGGFGRIRELCRGFDSRLVHPDACTYNVLIRGCFLVGCQDDAWKLFNEMREKGIRPNEVTFGTLISALCNNSELEKAFKLKEESWEKYGVRPNAVIYTSLIKALCDTGQMDVALELKNEMLKEETGLDSAVYTTLIRGLFREGRKEDVVGLLEEMKGNGLDPDVATYNAMIAGFCERMEFDGALEVLREMRRKGCKPDVVSYNILIAGYCKGKRWKEASSLFEDMPRRGCTPNVVSFRTFIDGLCDAEQFKEAAFLVDEMVCKGYKPHPAGACRIVEGLIREVDGRLWNVLHNLVRINSTNLLVWNAACSMACTQCKMANIQEILDRLKES